MQQFVSDGHDTIWSLKQRQLQEKQYKKKMLIHMPLREV